MSTTVTRAANPSGNVVTAETDPVTGVIEFSNLFQIGYTLVKPSGDVSGFTDLANVNALTSIGKHVLLAAGDFYFSGTVKRGFLRKADGTLSHNAIGGGVGTTSAIVGDMLGMGVDLTRLHFLDATIPGIEFWERTTTDDGTTAFRSHVGTAGTDYPIQWTGGKTGGFELIGAMPSPALLGAADDTVTVVLGGATYPKFANHIGLMVWGSGGDHHFFEIKTTKFGVGRVLHDCTLMRFDMCPIASCDIGEAHAIQWDLNHYNGCQIRDCRFGTMMEWNGILKAGGGWVKFPRESVGVVQTGATGTTGQSNTYQSCAWTGNLFSAIAGADVDNNTANGRMWTNVFQSCYWESNATEYYLIRNGSQGQHIFKECFFGGLDYAKAKSLRTNGALQTKWGVSQNTINSSFGAFWGISNASSDTSFAFENCMLYATPYGFLPRLNAAQLYWKNNYVNNGNGNSVQPSAAPAGEDATILTIMGYRGICLTSGSQWPVDNATKASIEATNYKDFYVNAGFVHERDCLPRRVDTSTALPAASTLLRGQIRVVTGANGAADTVQVCVKDAADAYSWKTVTLT